MDSFYYYCLFRKDFNILPGLNCNPVNLYSMSILWAVANKTPPKTDQTVKKIQ